MAQAPSPSRTRVMSPTQVARTLKRLAYEVVERNRGASNLLVFGLKRRGYRLAEILVDHINAVEAAALTAVPLDVSAYRDDRDRTHAPPPPELDTDLTDRDVILVDDVLFTGRTARAALDALVRAGRPRSIQLVILIDRGHREYPIQPSYVGRVIPTKHREHVVVAVEDDIAVYLEE